MKIIKNKRTAVFAILAVLSAIIITATIFNLSRTADDGVDIVCLDAGHGGADVGAVTGDGTRLEKDDNLTLTLKIKDKLEEQGIKVVLTREDNSDVSLMSRCKIANKARCDLFVSVHRNSAENINATGIEAWISNTASVKERKIATAVVDNICDTTGLTNRGLKRGFRNSTAGNYYINENTKMPSFLLEVGFLTNESDNKAFDDNLDENAQAIANTIASEFFNR